MNRHRAWGLVRGALTVILVALVGIGGGYAALNFARPVVTVTEAVEAPVVQAFYATGTILPVREYPIKTNVAGTISDVRVDKGDAVKKGQVLAIISDPDLVFVARQKEAELKEMEQRADEKNSPVLLEYDSKLSAINDQLDIAKREEKRLTGLIGQSAASQTDLDRAMDRVKQLWSLGESAKAEKAAKRLELQRQVTVAQAALDIAKWNMDQQNVTSPIDGVVLDRPTSLGTRVAINDHLMQVADVRPGNLVMRAQVDEEDVIGVKTAQAVRMTLYSFPGESFEGKVQRIYDKADPDRRTFEVDVRLLKEETRLAAGMTGELAFVLAAKDKAIVIPSQALQNGVIWTVDEGHLVHSQAQIGLKSVERIEILSGLKPGSRVLISPIGDMTEGKAVRTEYMDPAAAAGLNKPKAPAGNFKGFNG